MRARVAALAVLALFAVSAWWQAACRAGGQAKRGQAQAGRGDPTASSVSALGRLQPGRAVLSVSGQPGVRVDRLLVSEGQHVPAGEALALLEGHGLALAEQAAAATALSEAEERLRTETAYAEATIERARANLGLREAELVQARRDLERIRSLRSDQMVSEQSYDDQMLLTHTRELGLESARAELRTAETGLEKARAAIGIESIRRNRQVADARLAQTVIRAPIGGRILRIFTYPGEAIGSSPILKMGDTDKMYAVAEVDETDVGRVRVGQRATVTSPALGGEISGTVEEIGWMIHKNDVLNIDPRAPADTRVVEVRVRLDDPNAVAHLSQMEVETRIDTSTTAPSPAPGR